jgi:hypothetical protein
MADRSDHMAAKIDQLYPGDATKKKRPARAGIP